MFSSLNSKFIIPAVLIVSGIVGLSAFMGLRSLRSFMVELNRDRLRTTVKAVELQVIDIMLDQHGHDIAEKIDSLQSGPEITGIRIFDDTGVVHISRDRSDIGKTLEDFGMGALRTHGWSKVFEYTNPQGRFFAIAQPVANRQVCRSCHSTPSPANGLLLIEASFSTTEKKIRSLEKQTIIATIATIIVLSLAMWGLLTRLITHPVAVLVRKMNEAQKGNLSARVTVTRNDEIGRLVRTYNEMIEKLATTRKELESLYRQQIQRADRLASLGELSSSIAHEIKNPLGGISGAIQILKEDYPKGDSRRGILEEILLQIQRLDKTTKDLLSFARPRPPHLSIIHINPLVEKVLLLVDPQARKQKVQVVTRLDEQIPTIMVDEEQIQQALLNLFLNAIQAMPDGGTLTIRTEGRYYMNSDIILIVIEDTGMGIAPDHLARIFDPFFTTKSQGTGLGLAIAKTIIEGHQGGLFVESTPGRGTQFYVRLPVKRQDGEIAAAS